MKGKRKDPEIEDEMRPEYDFGKMKLVGRGVYAERYRAGTKFFLIDDEQGAKERDSKEDTLNESRNIPHPR
jgi:hypothetical protein